jgi:hypothetical protein
MPKRFNSNKKGNAREHEVIKDLTKRFGNGFYRSRQSGASATRKFNHYNESKKEFILKHTGDIITPPEFKFVIEVKHYKEFDFFTFWPGNSLIDNWFSQAEKDALRVDKEPLLLFKFNYKKKMACLSFKYKSILREAKVKYLGVNEHYLILTQKDLFNLHNKHFWENV